MDTQKECMIPGSCKLQDLPRFGAIVGTKRLQKALNAGIVRCVFLAEDADPDMTVPIAERCRKEKIPCCWVPTRKELGQACGIDVGAAAAAASR